MPGPPSLACPAFLISHGGTSLQERAKRTQMGPSSSPSSCLAHAVRQAPASCWPGLGLWEGTEVRLGYLLVTRPRRKGWGPLAVFRGKRAENYQDTDLATSLEDETTNPLPPHTFPLLPLPAGRIRQRNSWVCSCLPGSL